MASDHARCRTFAAAMEVLARPWTGLLIVTLEEGPLRFSAIGARVGPIGDRMLSLRLRDLEARGLVLRHVVPGPPIRVEYSLTDLGRGFREVASAISSWGEALVLANQKPKAARRPRGAGGPGSKALRPSLRRTG